MTKFEESWVKIHDNNRIAMLRNPSIDEKEQNFKYLSKSACQKAEVYSFNKGFYFTKFPGIEPKKCIQVIRKTVREIRKNGEEKVSG